MPGKNGEGTPRNILFGPQMGSGCLVSGFPTNGHPTFMGPFDQPPALGK